MNARQYFLSLAFLIPFLSGCVHAPQLNASERCREPATFMIEERLFFGRNIPSGGVVSETDWQEFVSKDVTPLFPEGLTIIDAQGQWLGEDSHQVEIEKSKVIILLHREDQEVRKKIELIARSYKVRFRQEAVLIEQIPVCTQLE